MFRIGIDLGGTKIEGIVLDASGRELFRKRIETQKEHGLPTYPSANSDALSRAGREDRWRAPHIRHGNTRGDLTSNRHVEEL